MRPLIFLDPKRGAQNVFFYSFGEHLCVHWFRVAFIDFCYTQGGNFGWASVDCTNMLCIQLECINYGYGPTHHCCLYAKFDNCRLLSAVEGNGKVGLYVNYSDSSCLEL